MTKKTIQIEAIENGTVLDHLPAGRALKLLHALHLPEDVTAGAAINVTSRSMGRKDLVFLADRELSPTELAKVSLLARGATLNVIRSGKVVRKDAFRLPGEALGALRCINPNCVTNHERVPTRFRMTLDPQKGLGQERAVATCHYCERTLTENEIAQAFT